MHILYIRGLNTQIGISKDSDCDDSQTQYVVRTMESTRHQLPIIEQVRGNLENDGLSEQFENQAKGANLSLTDHPVAIALPTHSSGKSSESDSNISLTTSGMDASLENVYEKLLLMPARAPIWTGSSSSVESINMGRSSGTSSSNRSPTRAKKRKAPLPPTQSPPTNPSTSIPDSPNSTLRPE